MDDLAAKTPDNVDDLHEQLRLAVTDLVMASSEAEFSRHAYRIDGLIIEVGNKLFPQPAPLFDQPEQQASAA